MSATQSEVTHVVFGMTGEYSDRSEWSVYAFSTSEAAEAYVSFLTAKRAELIVKITGKTGDDWLLYEFREELQKQMRAYDPEFSEDYTGTRWWVREVPYSPVDVAARATVTGLVEVLSELLFEDSDKPEAAKIATRLKARAAIRQATGEGEVAA